MNRRPGLLARLLLGRRGPRWLRTVGEVVVLTPREFLRDHALQWSSSLAFTTLLALVPLGILAFSLADTFERFLNLDQRVEDLLLSQGLPDAALRAGEQMRTMIDQARRTSGAMGLVGTGLLVLVGFGLFTALDRAVNKLWKTPPRRNPVRRFLAFWVTLTLGPVLLAVSLYATARLRAPSLLEQLAGLGFVVRTLVALLPYAITWVVFYIFYLILPNTPVRRRSALLSAVVAGTAWELAKLGFNVYVANAGQIGRVYGTLGILPVFMIWVYLTWIILLFGVELTYVDQNRAAIVAGVTAGGPAHGIRRELDALRLMVAVYRPFHTGAAAPDLSRLAREALLRTEVARALLEDLVAAGFVRRDRGGLFLPAREAARIEVRALLAAVRGPTPGPAEGPEWAALVEIFARGERAREAALADVTLDTLLE